MRRVIQPAPPSPPPQPANLALVALVGILVVVFGAVAITLTVTGVLADDSSRAAAPPPLRATAGACVADDAAATVVPCGSTGAAYVIAARVETATGEEPACAGADRVFREDGTGAVLCLRRR